MVLMVSAGRSGALSAEPCDVCQNCVQPSWTLWNMVDLFFLKLCQGQKASLTLFLLHFTKFSKLSENLVAHFSTRQHLVELQKAFFGFHVLVRHCGVRAVNCITASVRCATCFRQHWSRDERTNS